MYNRDAPYYADGRNSDQKTLVDTYTPESSPRTDNSFAEWLYGEYDEEKYYKFLALYHLPFIKQYFDYLLDARKAKEYMTVNQLDYEDIHDPRNMPQTISAVSLYRSGLNFVSDNVKRLYH